MPVRPSTDVPHSHASTRKHGGDATRQRDNFTVSAETCGARLCAGAGADPGSDQEGFERSGTRGSTGKKSTWKWAKKGLCLWSVA